MAAKPETSFIRRVNKKLPPEVHREKMANPFRGGTPDVYYEGTSGVLWAEYKFWTSVPRVIDVTEIVSPLQALWLNRAYDNGVNIAVIVGYQKGGRVFTWDEPELSGGEFKKDLTPIVDLAEWIRKQVQE